jgi:hypothetical protein
VRCSENACDFKREPFTRDFVKLPRIAMVDLWAVMLQCGRRGGAAKIRLGSIAGTFSRPQALPV